MMEYARGKEGVQDRSGSLLPLRPAAAARGPAAGMDHARPAISSQMDDDDDAAPRGEQPPVDSDDEPIQRKRKRPRVRDAGEADSEPAASQPVVSEPEKMKAAGGVQVSAGEPGSAGSSIMVPCGACWARCVVLANTERPEAPPM